jgi:hypothetical protein
MVIKNHKFFPSLVVTSNGIIYISLTNRYNVFYDPFRMTNESSDVIDCSSRSRWSHVCMFSVTRTLHWLSCVYSPNICQNMIQHVTRRTYSALQYLAVLEETLKLLL